ncbi:U3 small nucleolar RNA-associated protein 10 [Venturia inaequalis]|nr:U3 small nucleolar RNA-associated protein 10 [Venturia inaequalis]
MAPLPQRPQSPLPETRGNLTFGGNGLMVNGDIPYTTPGQLRAMLSIQGGLSMPAVSERWIRGQLDLYSIPHDSQLPAAQLSGALENAVRAGNCDNLPQDVENVLRDLQRRYRDKVGTAFRQLRDWCTANPKDADNLFEHLMSPTMEAFFDLDRFLDRHFPEVEADDRLQRPRDKKTHWAIALPCYRAKDSLIRKRTNDRRMKYEVGGFGIKSTYILAWAADPLMRLRNKYNDQGYTRLFQEKEGVMKQLYAQHVIYCNSQPPSIPPNPINRLACELLRPVGHWVVRCDTLVPMFDVSTIMTLDVHNIRHNPPLLASTHAQTPLSQRPIEECGILAAFDFALVRGTMALSVDPFVLSPFRRLQSSFDDAPCFHKRLYFEWVGHSQRGKLQRPDRLAMTGYLDFDEDYTIFKGVFQADAFGGELIIRGYKTSDTSLPRTIPMALASYVKDDDDEGSDDMDLASSSDEQDEQMGNVEPASGTDQQLAERDQADLSSEVVEGRSFVAEQEMEEAVENEDDIELGVVDVDDAHVQSGPEMNVDAGTIENEEKTKAEAKEYHSLPEDEVDWDEDF